MYVFVYGVYEREVNEREWTGKWIIDKRGDAEKV